MYTDLREFELARKSMPSASQDVKDLIAKQADWAMYTNDQQTAWYVCVYVVYSKKCTANACASLIVLLLTVSELTVLSCVVCLCVCHSFVLSHFSYVLEQFR